MNRILEILVLVFVVAGVAAAQVTPSGVIYNLANQHTYLVTPGPLSWQAARAYAHSLGGHLVAINDATEQNFIATTYGPAQQSCWIGLTDAASEGTFVWDSGEPFVYADWCSGQPDDLGGVEDYVEIFSSGGSTPCWNDAQSPGTGLEARRGIVELPYGVRVNFDGMTPSCSTSPFPTPLGTPGAPGGRLLERRGRRGRASSARRQRRPGRHAGLRIQLPPLRRRGRLRRSCRRPVPAAGSGLAQRGPDRDPRRYEGRLVRVRLHDDRAASGQRRRRHLDRRCARQPHGEPRLSRRHQLELRRHSPCRSALARLPADTSCRPGRKRSPGTSPCSRIPRFSASCRWNGNDNFVPSTVAIDSIQFWGTGKFQLTMSAPFGPGSIRVENSQGIPNGPTTPRSRWCRAPFRTAGCSGSTSRRTIFCLESWRGIPFTGVLDGSGRSVFTIPSGVPPGLRVFAVSILAGSEVTASAPQFFLTE